MNFQTYFQNYLETNFKNISEQNIKNIWPKNYQNFDEQNKQNWSTFLAGPTVAAFRRSYVKVACRATNFIVLNPYDCVPRPPTVCHIQRPGRDGGPLNTKCYKRTLSWSIHGKWVLFKENYRGRLNQGWHSLCKPNKQGTLKLTFAISKGLEWQWFIDEVIVLSKSFIIVRICFVTLPGGSADFINQATLQFVTIINNLLVFSTFSFIIIFFTRYILASVWPRTMFRLVTGHWSLVTSH